MFNFQSDDNVERFKIAFRMLENLNDRDDTGWTPLFYSVDEADIALVALFLDHGADPNLRDGLGLTALDHARINGDERIAQFLQMYGAQSADPRP